MSVYIHRGAVTLWAFVYQSQCPSQAMLCAEDSRGHYCCLHSHVATPFWTLRSCWTLRPCTNQLWPTSRHHIWMLLTVNPGQWLSIVLDYSFLWFQLWMVANTKRWHGNSLGVYFPPEAFFMLGDWTQLFWRSQHMQVSLQRFSSTVTGIPSRLYSILAYTISGIGSRSLFLWMNEWMNQWMKTQTPWLCFTDPCGPQTLLLP